MDTIEFTDRYGPEGPPSLRLGCRGDCEGTGYVPVYMPEGDTRESHAGLVRLNYGEDEVGADDQLAALWRAAEAAKPSGDGWHFVKCLDCGGTGRTQGRVARARQFVWWLGKQWSFARAHVLVRPYSNGTAALSLRWGDEHPLQAFEDGIVDGVAVRVESEGNPFRTAYADRLDVPNPWLWNRRIAIRILFGWKPERRGA